MPRATESLTGESSHEEIQQAISETIAQEVAEGRTESQAIAIAYSEAREKTGRKIGHGNPDEPFEVSAEEAEEMLSIYDSLANAEAEVVAGMEQAREAETPEGQAQGLEQEAQGLAEASAAIHELAERVESHDVRLTAIEERPEPERIEPDGERNIRPQRPSFLQRLPRWMAG